MLRLSSSKFFIATATCSRLFEKNVAWSSSSAAWMLKPSQILLAPAWMKADLAKRQKERERKQLEKMGINPDEDAEGEWVDPEEQARIDAAKAEKEKLRRQQEDDIRERRDKEDAAKRDKWKKWRAGQITKTQKVRAKTAEVKHQGSAFHTESREAEVIVDDGEAGKVEAAEGTPAPSEAAKKEGEAEADTSTNAGEAEEAEGGEEQEGATTKSREKN